MRLRFSLASASDCDCTREIFEDKSARTLATCFLDLMKDWFRTFVPEDLDSERELWFAHCLVGDGIPTNEAAAKIILAAQPRCWQVGALTARYFLLLAKCGTHQSALSAKTGVEGRVAVAASGGGKAHEGVTASAVRLFKYPPGLKCIRLAPFP